MGTHWKNFATTRNISHILRPKSIANVSTKQIELISRKYNNPHLTDLLFCVCLANCQLVRIRLKQIDCSFSPLGRTDDGCERQQKRSSSVWEEVKLTKVHLKQRVTCSTTREPHSYWIDAPFWPYGVSDIGQLVDMGKQRVIYFRKSGESFNAKRCSSWVFLHFSAWIPHGGMGEESSGWETSNSGMLRPLLLPDNSDKTICRKVNVFD